MRPVSSWGRLSADPHHVIELTDRDRVAAELTGATAPGIAHGLGKSYGDASLNPQGILWSTRGLDRLIAFDPASGRLTCEAGVVLRDIQRLMIPRGWTLPVVPGTQLVTVGGAIANDVHGKNHHAVGTFGEHVRRLRLVRSDGETIDCGPDLNPELFAATVGGLGLTGLIVEAELQLRPSAGPWLEAETLAFEGLDEFFRPVHRIGERLGAHRLVDRLHVGPSRPRAVHAGAAGTHGQRDMARTTATPAADAAGLPGQRPVAEALQRALLQRQSPAHRLAHRALRAVPLSARSILDWNRLYGPSGFFQYQSVVPRAAGLEATRDMLGAIQRSGQGSFLAVLKTFGPRAAAGLLSFPQPGVTLALDFRNSRALPGLFSRLDDIVRAAGGRLYPAKDARMPRALYEASYPNLAAFAKHRDPGMSSAMSRRLMGT